MNIRNKLIAISLVAAMGVSFTACSDSGSSDSTPAVMETLSSEEIEQVAKHDLTFQVYDPNQQNGVQQDAVESSADGQSADANSNNGGSADNNAQNGDANANNGDANANNGDANAQNGGDNANNNGDNNAQSGNNSSSGAIKSPDNIGSNNVDIPQKTGLQVISGSKLVAQAYWMDLSEQADKVFNGEYLKAQFKIKETAQNGIYPITIEKADFSNWGDPDPKTVKFVQIDGAIVVGGNAEENQFTDSTEPQLLVSNVSGNPGDTVTVIFKVKNNPGVVGNILNFSFNGDALEYLGGESGADFDGNFSS